MSIGEYLEREGYSESFKDNYLIVSWCLIECGDEGGLIVAFGVAYDGRRVEYAA